MQPALPDPAVPSRAQVTSEIHTIGTRAAGQSVTVFFSFLASFIIGQFFNTMFWCAVASSPATSPVGDGKPSSPERAC